ncbi:MAG: DVU0298 family protein [Nitrospirota bacterium]
MPEEPRCPFCQSKIDPPDEILEGMKLEFPLGTCRHCGSVYACDVTGHNMGAAALEALLFASGNDQSFAYSLSYGRDYDDAVIENYDIIGHKVVPERSPEGMPVKGALVFVRLKGSPRQEIKEEGEVSEHPPVKLSREAIRRLVEANLIDDLSTLALADARVLNEIHLMLYTPDDLLRWKIIDVLTKVCEKMVGERPDLVNKLIEKELQNAAYPGASPWGALETAGALISINPDLFHEFIPILLGFFRQENLRKGFAWAIGKIAAVKPDSVRYAHDTLRFFLSDKDPSVRAYAATSLGEFAYDGGVVQDLEKLETDTEKLLIWRGAL